MYNAFVEYVEYFDHEQKCYFAFTISVPNFRSIYVYIYIFFDPLCYSKIAKYDYQQIF